MLAGRPREEKAVKDDEGRKHCQNDDSNPKLSCGHGARQLRAPIQKANEARQKHIRGKSDPASLSKIPQPVLTKTAATANWMVRDVFMAR